MVENYHPTDESFTTNGEMQSYSGPVTPVTRLSTTNNGTI